MNRTAGAAACTLMAVGLVILVGCWRGPVTVRTQSRKVQCASNLRQIGIAAQLYLNEHRAFPFAEADASGTPRKGCEHLQILFEEEVLDNPEVVVCGASLDQTAFRNAANKFTLAPANCSYIWTRSPLGDEDPGSTPLAADKAEQGGPGRNCHPGGRNVLFLDGSVKWVSSKIFERDIKKHLTPE